MSETIVENKREYKYDNLKCILIFLVVFGHIIEPIEKLDILYMIIYSFHMPLFVFISGYFSKGTKKSIIKPFIIYLIFQTIYFLVDKLILGKDVVLDYSYPNWILWYIFALFVWNICILIIKNIKIQKGYCYIIILVTFLISLFGGYIDNLGYFLSLSRIVTFAPFFLLGYFTKNNNIEILKIKDRQSKENVVKLIVYVTTIVICILYFVNTPCLNRIWFYGAYSYKTGGYDIFFKIMWTLFSICMVFIFINFMPNKKTKISIIGRNTLYIYLLHGIIIKIVYLSMFLYKDIVI